MPDAMTPRAADAPTFPFTRTNPFDPPPQYAVARAAGAVCPVRLWNGMRAWLVTRHEDIKRVLSDDARFTGRMGDPDFPAITPARVMVDKNERAFVGMDNPDHDAYRAYGIGHWSIERVLPDAPASLKLPAKKPTRQVPLGR